MNRTFLRRIHWHDVCAVWLVKEMRKALSFNLTCLLLVVAFLSSSLLIMMHVLSLPNGETFVFINQPLPQTLESNSNSTMPIHSRSFYRYTKDPSGLNGFFTFETDVYLIGMMATGCASRDQNFEVYIAPYNMTVEWVGEVDENGNDWYDWVGGVYFYLRVEYGKASDFQMLPHGYGFFVPEGEEVGHGLWSLELGSGGQFTVYYVEV